MDVHSIKEEMSELSDEELQQIILESRNNRRKKKEKPKTKTKKKKAKAKSSFDNKTAIKAALANMSPEEQQAFLKKLQS